MSDISGLLDDFGYRVRQLLHKYAELEQAHKSCQQKLEQQIQANKELQRRLQDLQERHDHLRMAKYIDMADDDMKGIRSRISKMVRDIDKCIAMLKVN